MSLSLKQPYRLDLGCGRSLQSGWIGIDKGLTPNFPNDIPKGSIFYKRTLEKGLPLEDESVIEIKAHHIFEHIQDFEFLIFECWRVLIKGGIINIRVPHWSHPSAYGDPTHCRFITEDIFKNFYKTLFDIKDIELWSDGQLCFKLVKK